MKSVTLRRPALREELRRYLLAFLLGFGSLLVVILPIIIADGGYYIYYGDYNSQQIPFTIWQMMPFAAAASAGTGTPTSVSTSSVPMPFICWAVLFLADHHSPPQLGNICHAGAAVHETRHRLSDGICLYPAICTQSSRCHDRRPAVCLFRLPAVQHFLQPLSGRNRVFPLLLIAMEELVNQNRRGVFALSVALLAAINYFFFTGQVVFLVLYFIVRCFSKDFHASLKKFSSFCWRQSLA